MLPFTSNGVAPYPKGVGQAPVRQLDPAPRGALLCDLDKREGLGMDVLGNTLSSGKIIVLDDSDYGAAAMAGILRTHGYRDIRTETDPRRAAPLHAEHDFDLILLDFRMPHMDGIQVVGAMKATRPRDYLPAVMVTGDPQPEVRLQALTAGVKDFLTKPFSPEEMMCRVRNVMLAALLLKDRRREVERLEQAVRERTAELDQSRNEILSALARAGEFRDNETGRHVQRISHFAIRIAAAAGLDQTRCDLLFHASAMHDIGKIGVPDQILLKPGPLNAGDRERMNAHPEIGGNIIGKSQHPLLAMARMVARTHHEKWDGTGYPCGLAGEAIPIEGRITALCDVFDALTTARSYKPAWTLDAAADYIQAEAGRHFDPALVEVFVDILPDLAKIAVTLSDNNADSHAA